MLLNEAIDTASKHLSPEVVLRLVSNHHEFLAFLQKRRGDRALAEDIPHEAFVRGLHKLGTLESDESAIAWFYPILRNVVIDHHRRRASVDKRLEAFALELDQHMEPEGEVRGAVCRCVGELAGGACVSGSRSAAQASDPLLQDLRRPRLPRLHLREVVGALSLSAASSWNNPGDSAVLELRSLRPKGTAAQ